MGRFRAVTTFRVTRVETANTVTGETFTVPGMICTVAQVQAMCDCAPATVNVICEDCGESVADCPTLRDKIAAPAQWSWRWNA